MVDGWPYLQLTPHTGGAAGQILYLHGGAYAAEIAWAHWTFLVRLSQLTNRRGGFKRASQHFPQFLEVVLSIPVSARRGPRIRKARRRDSHREGRVNQWALPPCARDQVSVLGFGHLYRAIDANALRCDNWWR